MLGRTSGCAFGVKALEAELWARGHGSWVYREFISHASAGANAGSSLGKGLKVIAIRKAPIPIAQEPT